MWCVNCNHLTLFHPTSSSHTVWTLFHYCLSLDLVRYGRSFLTKTKRDQVMSMGKFGPTAPNFCYAFWAESGLLKGSEKSSTALVTRYDHRINCNHLRHFPKLTPLRQQPLRSHHVVPKSPQSCPKIAPKLSPSLLQVVSVYSQNCPKATSKLSQSCLIVVLKLFQNCLEVVLKLSESCIKGVSNFS